MHIGLNAHLLSLSRSYRSAGINWYIYSLLRHLPTGGDHHSYTVFLGDKKAREAFPGMKTKTTPLPTSNPMVRIFWEQVVQPMQLLSERIDLLHSLAFVQPVILPCAGIVTIYDLSFILFPERLQAWRRLYLRWGTQYSARRAKRIIAISGSTKRDIVELLRIAEDKVSVVPCGVGEDFQPVDDKRLLDDFRRKRHLPEQMILFVGTIEPRKNLETLLRGYALLKETLQPPALVIGGPKGWHHKEVFDTADRLGLYDDVIFPGYIPQQELALWYSAAELFIYPSLYEGFGLPPLEAMACGTPVIVSDTPSLVEVVDEAGIAVGPHTPQEMAEAMQRLLTDSNLREEMRQRGLERARQFSWHKAGRETLRAYEQAMADSGA